MSSTGPLAGINVLEVESIGPGPFAAMILADMGANVLRIARPGADDKRRNPVLSRGRAGTLPLNLKNRPEVERLIGLMGRADALIEGFRPGVMERLGLGPEACMNRNSKLVYGRVTGWGRSGPLAQTAGHDINYIGMRGMGRWPASRAGNLLDGSAYFYTCYKCSDGGWMAVGALELKFRLQLLNLLGLGAEAKSMLVARDDDPDVRKRIADVFRSRSRSEWQRVFDGTDACVSPVLDLEEARLHPQNADWGTFSQVNGMIHPNPAPRFSRSSTSRIDSPNSRNHRMSDLQAWGLSGNDVL